MTEEAKKEKKRQVEIPENPTQFKKKEMKGYCVPWFKVKRDLPFRGENLVLECSGPSNRMDKVRVNHRRPSKPGSEIWAHGLISTREP